MFATLGYYICVPFAWLLRAFYTLTGSYGLALVLFTLVVKVVLLPFQLKSKKSMVKMGRFQPKIKEIQKKYANNQQKMNEEMQLLYAQEGINPMSGCLWSFLPLPILIALYSIIRQPLTRFMLLKTETADAIRTLAASLGYVAEEAGRASFYEEINLVKFMSENFAQFEGKFEGIFPMNYNFIGLDLTVMPGNVWKEFFTGGWPIIGVVLIPIVSAVLSFFQSKVAMATNNSTDGDDATAKTSRTMTYMMPLLSLWIGFTMPAALGVYWIANSIFQTIQDYFLNKYYKDAMDKEESDKERAKREARVQKMQAAREQQRKWEEEKNTQKTLKEKRAEKQAEKEKNKEKKSSSTTENGRIGDRPYARGRSFSEDHYGE